MNKKLKNKNFVLLGGAGFIGSNLVVKLIELNAKITVVDNFDINSSANQFNIKEFKKKIKLINKNYLEIKNIKKIIKDADFIINLISQSGHAESIANPIKDLNINTVVHLKFLQDCLKYNKKTKILLLSTRQLYGKPNSKLVNEKHRVNPLDFNGISKLATDLYYQRYHDIHLLNTCILRLTNIYGPKMRIKDSLLNFMGFWFYKIINSENIQIYGNGNQKRDIIFIDDLINLIISIFSISKFDGRVYNVGNSKSFSLNCIAKKMITQNAKSKIIKIKFPKLNKKIDIGTYQTNINKIKKEFKWEPTIDIEEGILKTLKYFRKNYNYYKK